MCVTSLLCGPWADLWPFYGLYCKRFSLSIKGVTAVCSYFELNGLPVVSKWSFQHHLKRYFLILEPTADNRKKTLKNNRSSLFVRIGAELHNVIKVISELPCTWLHVKRITFLQNSYYAAIYLILITLEILKTILLFPPYHEPIPTEVASATAGLFCGLLTSSSNAAFMENRL